MKYSLIIALLLLSLCAGLVSAQDFPVQISGEKSNTFRYIPNNAFDVGEVLSFDIYWEIAHVGSATLKVKSLLEYNNRGVYEVESRALSNKVISSFYSVDDRVISYIDTAGIFSHRVEKHLKEGKYRADRLFLLDQATNTAISREDTITIPEYCQDILSSFYYVRTLDLKVGDKIDVPNFDNDKVYDIVVNVLKKQKIRVPAGTFDCLIIEPKLRSEGLFKHEGRITIYLTDDEKKIPVMLVSKVIFGEVAAKLIKIENINP